MSTAEVGKQDRFIVARNDWSAKWLQKQIRQGRRSINSTFETEHLARMAVKKKRPAQQAFYNIYRIKI